MPTVSADIARPPLLPAALAEKLAVWLARWTAALLCGLAAFGWLSLLTWSAADPSLSQATSNPVSNVLGSWGAIGADALLQTLGAAAVVVLLFLMFWGVELALAKCIVRWPERVCLTPIAALALAGGSSALPKLAGWPLHHGYGGIVGDLTLGLCVSLLGFLNPTAAQVSSGLLLCGGGLFALAFALGLWPASAFDDSHADPAPTGPAFDLYRLSASWRSPHLRVEPTLGSQRMPSPGMPVGPRRPFEWTPEFMNLPAAGTAEALLTQHETGRGAKDGEPPGGDTMPSDATFEAMTERASDIAQRFAPPRPRSFLSRRRQPARVEPASAPPADRAWQLPNADLLHPPRRANVSIGADLELRAAQRALESVLSDFGVESTVRAVQPGPVVTSFELTPCSKAKCDRIIGLADDIARALGHSPARASVGPRNSVVIELPNARREPILVRELLTHPAYRTSAMTLPLALGVLPSGAPFVGDLAVMPSLLVGGAAGSGKTVGLHAMVLSLAYRQSPAECRLLMLGSTAGQLAVYSGIPHLAAPISTRPEDAFSALQWALREIAERHKRMAQLGVDTIRRLNARVREARTRGESPAPLVLTGFDDASGQAIYEHKHIQSEVMPHVVIVIEDLAELLSCGRADIAAAIERLARTGGEAGVHLIAATQDVREVALPERIKREFPCRISFKAVQKSDSRLLLGAGGAEQLLGNGDMLLSQGPGDMRRLHGPLVTNEEVAAVAKFLRRQARP